MNARFNSKHGLWIRIRYKDIYTAPWAFPSTKEIVGRCAVRWMRLYKKNTIKEWNEICWRIAENFSGNPNVTQNALRIGGPDRNLNKPVTLAYASAEPKRACWIIYNRQETLNRLLKIYKIRKPKTQAKIRELKQIDNERKEINVLTKKLEDYLNERDSRAI